jgi:hypothetical protein
MRCRLGHDGASCPGRGGALNETERQESPGCSGKAARIHTTKVLRLSQDLPVVVEIVDSADKIDAFLPVLDGMMSGGLVTMEKVQVLQYGSTRP